MRSRLKALREFLASHVNVPFVNTNLHFGSYVLFRLISAPLRGKVGALKLGAAGLGTFGVLQNFQMLTFSIGSLGLGNGLTAEISARVKSNDAIGVDAALAVSFAVLTSLSLLITVVLAAGAGWIAESLLGDRSQAHLLYAPILALPFYCLGTCYLEPILYGHGLQAEAGRAYRTSTIADLICFVTLVLTLGLFGASLGIFLAVFVHFLAMWIQVRARCPRVKLFRFGFSSSLISKFLKTGLTVLLAGAATYGSALAVRALIVRWIGETDNGHFQVALSLSAFYIPFVTSGTWVRLYPQAGGLGLDSTVATELTQALAYSAVFASLAQCFLMIAPDLLIRLLYTSEFLPAIRILPLRFTGDYAFLLAQPVLGVLLGLSARRKYLGLVAASQALLVLLSFSLKDFGLNGPIAAYAISQLALCAVCCVWFFLKIRNFPMLRSQGLKIAAFLVLPIAGVAAQGALLWIESPVGWRAALFLGLLLGSLASLRHARFSQQGA